MRTADGQAITTGVATGLGEAGFMALMRHSESLQLQGGLPENSSKNKKRILFLKNEPGKLLKTNDQPKKRTGNEPETKLQKSLKIKDGPKNEPETNRKTKRAMLLKIKDAQKTNRKNLRKTICKNAPVSESLSPPSQLSKAFLIPARSATLRG